MWLELCFDFEEYFLKFKAQKLLSLKVYKNKF